MPERGKGEATGQGKRKNSSKKNMKRHYHDDGIAITKAK